MARIKKLDILGAEVGSVEVDDAWLSHPANSQMVKDYIVALRFNKRQWSASTKTRAEVNHSGQKPRPQKGSGRARQGYMGAPQYKGGGRVGAPRPKKNQHICMNRKERQAAVRSLLAEKIQSGALVFLESPVFDSPKTKRVAGFLKSQSVFGKKVLFIGDKTSMVRGAEWVKSIRNIPGAGFVLFENVSGYDIAAHRSLIFMGSTEERLIQVLAG